MGSHLRNRHPLLARAAAAITTLGVALAGAVVLNAAPASAKLSETDFGFQTNAYGTRVKANDVSLRSGRTAFSYISCTRLAGIDRDRRADDIATVDGNDMVEVGGIVSSNQTYRRAKKQVVGVKGVNTIASVKLGPADGPRLVFEGLSTTARAWHGRDGFRTDTSIRTGSIDLLGVDQATDGPLGDLLDGVDSGIQGVFDALRENGGAIEIPGLGVVHIGYEHNTYNPTTGKNKHRGYAQASAYALRVDLANKSQITLGRAWAKITKNIPAGVFSGSGYGAEVDVIDGVLASGRITTRQLPCQGTRGRVLSSDLAGADLGGAGQLQIGALGGRAYGVQRKDGSATGWTEGRVARARLGGGALVVKGIVGRANVRQTRSGKIFRSSTGTTIGSIVVNGQEQGIPTEPQTIEIPGGALKLEANVSDRSRRGIRVTALKITLVDGTPGKAVIRLGNAEVRLRRH
jgi:hypothetical protein